jgi:hypothetical protein
MRIATEHLVIFSIIYPDDFRCFVCSLRERLLECSKARRGRPYTTTVPSMTELELWTRVISAIITAVGVVLAAVTLVRGLQRGRRELAVSLIYNWAKDLDWPSARSINLAKELDKHLIALIQHKQRVTIPSKYYDASLASSEAGFLKRLCQKDQVTGRPHFK